MSNETIILAQNLTRPSLGSSFFFTEKTPGPGHYRQDNTTRIATYDFTNFVGTVKIQASLELTPGVNDWFDVTGTLFVSEIAANTTENYSFNGNFVWIRSAYNLQSGVINRITTNGISVTSAAVIGTNPSIINFADIANKPTTLAGYGITDAVSISDLGVFEFDGNIIRTNNNNSIIIERSVDITSNLNIQGNLTINGITVESFIADFDGGAAATIYDFDTELEGGSASTTYNTTLDGGGA